MASRELIDNRQRQEGGRLPANATTNAAARSAVPTERRTARSRRAGPLKARARRGERRTWRRAAAPLDPVRLNSATRRYRGYTAFLCCDLAALSPAAAARLYISSVFPLKDSGPRCQGESTALLRLADESPIVIFRCSQSSQLLTIAAAVASGKPAHVEPDSRPVLYPDHTCRYASCYVCLIRFSFLMYISLIATLDAWLVQASHPCII